MNGGQLLDIGPTHIPPPDHPSRGIPKVRVEPVVRDGLMGGTVQEGIVEGEDLWKRKKRWVKGEI